MNTLRFALLGISIIFAIGPTIAIAGTPRRPNVILIMADDMGHGDLGFHGNPIVKTPHLDGLAKQSVRMKHFYVSPVCSPTRSSLLTGRYNYRTGVVDTFIGRSLMHGDEVTLAELLVAAGYRTGIFGKWHLGDNYPLRAMDQGFQETLVLRGGGIGQPSDPPTPPSPPSQGGERGGYFDPVLQHNGKQVQKKGYCSDVFTDAALDFIGQNREKPFFCYLAFNAPHTPLQVPDRFHQMYAKLNLGHDQFPKFGQPLPGKANQDDTAKVYGMVSNIDANIGRLLVRLAELNLADNTIVIFLTDNGPQQVRYNSGMLMRKGSVHEGGVRVPCFIRWPAQLPKDRDVEPIAAHIDIVPTLAAACGVKLAEKNNCDGVNLLPLWKGEKTPWPERTLFVQWHRGDVPELYRAFAARTQDWRLVQPEGVGEKPMPGKVRFKLYDMTKDPFEQRDIADANPAVVAKLKEKYEAWFRDVSATRGYDPPRIHLGSDKENPTVLTRQDWRGAKAGWTPTSVGHWEVHVERAGDYRIDLLLPAGAKKGVAHFRFGETHATVKVDAQLETASLAKVRLGAGPGKLEAWVEDGDSVRGMRFVEVRRLDP